MPFAKADGNTSAFGCFPFVFPSVFANVAAAMRRRAARWQLCVSVPLWFESCRVRFLECVCSYDPT